MQSPWEHELEIGRRIQASFLPEEIPQFPGWEISARFQPARQVAGDFYDVFPLVQNRRLGLVIGDVCDKGVGAALFMAIFRTLIRAFARQPTTLRWMDALAEDGPSRAEGFQRQALPSTGTSALRNAIELTNTYIAETHGSTNMFATVFLGVLDPADGLLLYVNAGHECPLVIDARGIKERLRPTGPVAGIIPGAHFGIRTVKLEPGETLLAFTDGVTEAQNAAGAFFGQERVDALAAQPAPSASALLDAIQQSLRDFAGDADPSDDVALLALRRD